MSPGKRVVVKDNLCGYALSFRTLFNFYLKRGKLSQAEFARRVGLSQPSVNLVCNGKTLPELHRLPLWASVLNLSERERRYFIDAGALDAAPPRVRDILMEVSSGRHPLPLAPGA